MTVISRSETMNSRRKGKGYELEIAHALTDYGYNARRGQQYCGANGDADVVGLPGVHIEAKRRKTIGNIYDWMEQAKADAKTGEIPAVFFRADHSETLVTVSLEDFMTLYSEYGAGMEWAGCAEQDIERKHLRE